MQHALATLRHRAHRQLFTPRTSERMVTMADSSEYPNASALSFKATLRSLIDAMRGWRSSFLDLAIKRKHDLLIGGLLTAACAATAALKRSQSAFAPVLSQPQSAVQKSVAVEPWATQPALPSCQQHLNRSVIE